MSKTTNVVLFFTLCVPAAFAAVAFTAKASSSGSVSGGSTVTLGTVVTNVGEAYNPSTGVFTAPESGMYMFTFHAVTSQGDYVLFDLMAGGDTVSSLWARGRSGEWESGSQSAVLQLASGEEVYLRSRPGYTSEYLGSSSGQYTAFSGVKVFDSADCPA